MLVVCCSALKWPKKSVIAVHLDLIIEIDFFSPLFFFFESLVLLTYVAERLVELSLISVLSPLSALLLVCYNSQKQSLPDTLFGFAPHRVVSFSEEHLQNHKAAKVTE